MPPFVMAMWSLSEEQVARSRMVGGRNSMMQDVSPFEQAKSYTNQV